MIYERIAGFLPQRISNWMENELEYSGMNLDARRFLGFIMGFGIGLSLAIAVNAFVILDFPLMPTFVLCFALFAGGALFWINSVAESKGRFTEKVLPDALQLIASNIKAGLTTERALFVSARPEFGPLADELKSASKLVLSGERMETALLQIARKIKSRVLERTIWLITQGIKSGGQISNLLIQLSDDLREENALKSEISANISMYAMLIFFSAAFGAPLLFGISGYIVGVLGEQTANIGISQEEMEEYAARSPALRIIGIPTSEITADFIAVFAQTALFFTCLFASLTLGVINTGNEKAGIKYLPILLAVSFALFHITGAVMAQFFGNVMFMF